MNVYQLIVAAQQESEELRAANGIEYVDFLRVLRRSPALSALLAVDAQSRIGTFKVVTCTEGDIDDVYEFTNLDKANAFCSGFTEGGNAYGAGSAQAWVVPIDTDEMRRDLGEGKTLKIFKAAGMPLPSQTQ